MRNKDCAEEVGKVFGRQMKKRTKEFALRVIRLVESLETNTINQVLGRQLLRSGTSVGGNFRSSQRARPKREFVARLAVVEEECDEALFWMELLVESGAITQERISALMKEANEILAIIVSSIRSSKKSRS